MTPWYAIIMGAGLIVGAAWWGQRFRHRPEMVVVYACAVLGALVGAKLGYIVAEWPWVRDDADRWRQVLHGKTILGALLGGYLGVEAGKRLAGYRQPTGDLFAVAVPAGLVLGRVGCLLYGCCLGVTCRASWWTLNDAQGVARWPAAPTELAFNGLAAGVLLVLAKRGVWRGQLFHVYLIAYALFRLLHEPMRATPKVSGVFSPYQGLAAVLLCFAAWRWWVRQKEQQVPIEGTAA